MKYEEFLGKKEIRIADTGKTISESDINPILFPFQRDIVRWSVRKGRCAVFLDTGLGKTFIQLEWARILGGTCLIFAPLSVARQTIREGKKIGITVKYVRSNDEIESGINITNYEMLDHFRQDYIDSVVLDESSILKSLSGKTRNKLITEFSDVKFKLCCTATPAPNDYTELGNHAQFLNVCTMQEMLAMFFINANREHTFIYGDTILTKKGSNAGGTEWRIKHHAEKPFFQWLSQWSILMTKPSDLGYEDKDFDLPQLNIIPHFLSLGYKPKNSLFFMGLSGLEDRIDVRRKGTDLRVEKLKSVLESSPGQWIVWCGLDSESKAIRESLNGVCREAKGQDTPEHKASTFESFQDGGFQVLLTKPKIGGYGMNFQNASNMVFFGLNDSWETYYQAIRREWRYGQKKPVNVHILISDLEGEIYKNIQRKEAQAIRLRVKMIEQLKDFERNEIKGVSVKKDSYKEDMVSGDGYKLMLGDSCKRMAEIKTESIDLSIYSPPFADLFVYSNSDRDLGNSRNWDEFFEHYSFIVADVLRVTKMGRLSCVHTSDIPAMANRDGYIGLRDFPGRVIKLHEENGWIFVGRAFVQKNPQAQAIRVKSKSLLFVQMRKDSTHSRPALVDQVLIFKKPGENLVPITPVENGEMNNEIWISWAHGIWTDINETETLQYSRAREQSDEKHICPLQLGTIERCIKLYSNPQETVFTPFMGIGSEVYMALKLNRKAVGIELKESYYREAVANVKSVQGKLI